MSLLVDYHLRLSQRITAATLKGIESKKDQQRLDLQGNDPIALRVFQICNLIEDYNIWQCRKGKVTWMMQEQNPDKFGNRAWFSVERSTLQANYSVLREPIIHPAYKAGLDPFEEFLLIMEELERTYKDVVQKWDGAASGELNILEPHFCKPNEFGDTHYHWLIDSVFKSVTGGGQKEVEHLQKVILRRHQAHDPFLPGQFFSDEGDTGKTLMVQRFIYALFGGLVHDNASMGHVTGKFNEEVAGRAVIYINEAVREKTDMEALKMFMGSKSVRVEAKFEKPYNAQNCSLIICSGNSETGSVSLKGKGADRRFSLYSSSATIQDWIVKGMKAYENRDFTLEQAKIWLQTEGQYILEDQIQIGMWLSAMIKKYGDVGPVSALRNDAYDKMLKMQRGAWLDFVTEVFRHPKFVYISKGRLDDMIRHYSKGELLPGPTLMAKRIEDLCKEEGLLIEKKQQVYVKTGFDDVTGEVLQQRMTVWTAPDRAGSIDYDESLFGEYDTNKRWIYTWKH